MRYKELEGIGLTKSEVAVYTTLLKIGQSATGNIIKEARISSGKIYEVLGKLIEKGLVSFIIKNKVRNFSATSPKKLKEYLNKKKKELEDKEKVINKIIPNLEGLQKGKKSDYIVEVYEGFEGFKASFLYLIDSLKKGDEYFGMGIGVSERTKGIELFYHKIEKLFNEKRIKKKFILSEEPKEPERYMKDFKGDFRKLQGFHLAPFGVAGEIVMLHNFKELSVIIIKNKTIAEQFKFLFESLWKVAENLSPERYIKENNLQ